MAKCPYCGKENMEGSKFCAWCGREKPDAMYLNAEQLNEPWTYVPPNPAGQTQPGAIDPAQPIEGATAAAEVYEQPEQTALEDQNAFETAEASESQESSAPAPEKHRKNKKRLLIIPAIAVVVVIGVIAALVVPQFSSRQTAKTAANADGTIQINKPVAELPGAQHWSDDTADYAYYIQTARYSTHVYIVITNKTDKDIGIKLKVRAKDASGAFVGKDASGAFVDEDGNAMVTGLGAGCSTLEWIYWSDPLSAVSIELEPEYYDPNSSWKDAVPDLTVKATPYKVDSKSGVYMKDHKSRR